MDPKVPDAPVVEPKNTETPNPAPEAGASNDGAAAPAADPAKPAADSVKVGEALETTPPAAANPAPESEKSQPRMVPEAVVIQLKKDMKILQKKVESGETAASEISDSLKDIGTKHNVDPAFLQEFAAAVRSESESEFNARLEKELEPFKKQSAEANQAKVDKVFAEHFKKTLESMPEYKGVANEEVIKALALNPKNANKTFADIFEEAYGHLVGEKRTFDGAGPGSGKDNAEIDFDRAAKDTKYFDSIMANPTLKQKYNEGIEGRLKL